MKQPKRPLSAIMATTAVLWIATSQSAYAREVKLPFSPANFSHPLTINNPLLPMVPVTTFIYKAEGPDGCEENHVTVTSGTKSIAAGVTARVVQDIGYEDENCDGTLVKVEETFDWFAQDNAGNVWYVGEDSRDCANNVCTPSDGSWEAGVDGAVAGIIMLASPRPGDHYQQEFYEGHAEDEAAVLRDDAWVSLYREDAYPPRDFHNCLKTKESTKLEGGSIEDKFYCPNIGLIAVEEHHGKTVRFELVSVSGP